MIQFFNNILNNLFIGIKYMTYIVSVICFLVLYPLLMSLHKANKRKFRYPPFLLFNWIMKIEKFFNKIIF